LQGSVSLSSAEAEYYAMIAGLSEAMGVQHFLEELGMKLSIRLLTDSSAAKAGAERLGLLHQKHMKIRDLFLSDLVAQGAVTVEKIGTKENPADFLTKPMNGGYSGGLPKRIVVPSGSKRGKPGDHAGKLQRSPCGGRDGD